jgi:hypothetical protein
LTIDYNPVAETKALSQPFIVEPEWTASTESHNSWIYCVSGRNKKLTVAQFAMSYVGVGGTGDGRALRKCPVDIFSQGASCCAGVRRPKAEQYKPPGRWLLKWSRRDQNLPRKTPINKGFAEGGFLVRTE